MIRKLLDKITGMDEVKAYEAETDRMIVRKMQAVNEEISWGVERDYVRISDERKDRDHGGW